MNMQAALDTIDGRKIYLYPEQPQMQVEVILASKGPHQSKPLYTIRMRYPRIIHGEIMTHRVFSRNARSSRAVPVKTMLDEVLNIPFIPWHWGKNQKGMQANQECNNPVIIPNSYVNYWDSDTPISREAAWLYASERTVEVAEAFMEADYHKQIPNRLLEPFSWIDTLITATEWDNFLWLRDHTDAEPHLQDLARLVRQAIDNADVEELKPGQWHLPYITEEDWKTEETQSQTDSHLWLCKISAARCARISYKPFDGDASYERELERYDSLVTADLVHASPLEHQATPDKMCTYDTNIFDKTNDGLTPIETLEFYVAGRNPELHGNLDGWIQYRKTIPNEAKTVGVLDTVS